MTLEQIYLAIPLARTGDELLQYIQRQHTGNADAQDRHDVCAGSAG